MSAGRTPEVVVAVVQTAPGDDPARNRRTITDLTEEAVRRGAQVVVFPEYSSYFSPDLGPAYLDAAEPTDGPFVRHLTALADRLGVEPGHRLQDLHRTLLRGEPVAVRPWWERRVPV